MHHGAAPSHSAATPYDVFLRVLGFVTVVLTIPQAWSVWHGGAGGASLVTWSAYLASAIAWLFYGIRRRNMTIYLECIAWIILDVAIIVGVVVNT